MTTMWGREFSVSRIHHQPKARITTKAFLLSVLNRTLKCSRWPVAISHSFPKAKDYDKWKENRHWKGPSRPPVSLHLSILYGPTISNKTIISLNWTHFIGHPSKYQFKLNKIRKVGGASLLDGILHTDRGVTAGLKWINELTPRGWSEWPWVNTPAAEPQTGVDVEVLWKRAGHW